MKNLTIIPNRVSETRKYGYLLVTFLVILVLFLIAGSLTKERSPHATYGLAILLLGCLPGIIYFQKKDQESIPLLPLHGLFYSFTFGFPVFSDLIDWRGLPGSSIDYALELVITGLVLLYVSYYFVGRVLFYKVAPVSLKNQLSFKHLTPKFWLIISIYILYRIIPNLSEIPSLGQLLNPLGYFTLGFFYILYLKGILSNIEKNFFLFLILPVVFIDRFTSGALAQVFLLMLFYMIIYWQIRKKIPLFFIGILMAFYMIFNPAKMHYRTLITSDYYTDLSRVEKTGLFFTAAYEYYKNVKGKSFDKLGSTQVGRINHITTFAYVVHNTPGTVPYWDGHTYEFLLVSFIPRFIWPGKPESSYGNEFGHRYALLNKNDYVTSFNLPWLPEFYANYGEVGVYIGMALVGLLFRLLVVVFASPKATIIEYLLGLTLLFSLFYAESNLAGMLGGFILSFISLYFIMYLISRRV